ncbi:MAG: DUF3168 domain-containing protein [Loktanella sp.]|nr:DUF3168 domain-containing protein [Loktanella sp.]
MKIEFRALLASASGVSGIVGNRIHWDESPQATPYPRIVLHGISRTALHTMRGTVNLKTRRIQVDVYTLSAQSTQQLADAVEAVLDGYSGVNFQGIFLENIRDGREKGSNEAERPYFAQLDFTVNFHQP